MDKTGGFVNYSANQLEANGGAPRRQKACTECARRKIKVRGDNS